MSSIHTPEGFKAAFLSNQDGGALPPSSPTSFPAHTYPKMDFVEFLMHKTTPDHPVYKVKLNDGTTLFAYEHQPNPSSRRSLTLSDLEIKATSSVSAGISTLTSITGDVVIIHDKLVDEKATAAYTSLLMKEGKAIYNAFYDRNPLKKMMEVLTTKSLATDKVDPYIATRILLGFNYAKDRGGKYFLGGNAGSSKVKEFVEEIFLPTLYKSFEAVREFVEDPCCPTGTTGPSSSSTSTSTSTKYAAKQQFIANIVELVNAANAYGGAHVFDVNETMPQTKVSLQREPWDVRSSRELRHTTIEEIERQLRASVNQSAAISRKNITNLAKYPFVPYTLTVGMRGGGNNFFNKADVYQSWLDAKLSQLKGMNKDLSASSKNKVLLIIDQIRTRENTLKLIDESLEAVKLDNNYNPEVISDLGAFKKLEDQHNQVAGALNRSYIKFADLVNTLASQV
jgi:hypothetical protein